MKDTQMTQVPAAPTPAEASLRSHWLFLLQSHQHKLASQRRSEAQHPLTPGEQQEAELIAAAFLVWYRDVLPVLQSNRAYLSALQAYTAWPMLMVRTTPVGVQAIRRTLEDHERLFVFTPEEWASIPEEAMPPATARIEYTSLLAGSPGEIFPGLAFPWAQAAQLRHLDVPAAELAWHLTAERFTETAGSDTWHLWRRREGSLKLLEQKVHTEQH